MTNKHASRKEKNKMKSIKCKHCGEEIGCGACGETFRTRDALAVAIARGHKYCGRCGKEIASTLVEALANADD